MLPCSIPKRVRVSHIPGNVNQYCCDYTTLFQTETWKDWHQPTTISWQFRRMSSINNLSQYVYIENLPFRWVCMWYRHVCTEQKYVHTRNVFLPVNYTNTRTHTHLGISYITATHRKLCSIHVPRLQAYYVCACDFGHFICFFWDPLHVLKTHPFSVPVLLTFAASPSTLPLSAEECCCGWSIM